MCTFDFRAYSQDAHRKRTMDLDTTFELVFVIVASILAIAGIWLAAKHRRNCKNLRRSISLVESPKSQQTLPLS
ncbi:hypothetical protein BAUCODRAFT_509616 [Baudoinia panamericana UAMH 10762]|uniref:Uncharacterized protein n=1 Tax=Baudoinia panamericana (strain UAMH 10762) TaxID=717646 RepID=M2N9X3_BAUPA|nr:uncharacterized protein BAUCODRAFT_509616 [Baudoinia panamericana UAMH 10762]EMC95934.1 hypothetical protein BAUCODRAFT_509616 [Baudoinia panamericana UAMH 10762]